LAWSNRGMTFFVVPGTGVEPACPLGQMILSHPCIPFHHPGLPVRVATTVTLTRARHSLPTTLMAVTPASRGVAT
jgi:hypothetical protein